LTHEKVREHTHIVEWNEPPNHHPPPVFSHASAGFAYVLYFGTEDAYFPPGRLSPSFGVDSILYQLRARRFRRGGP
jgi:hypothetical protein